MRRHSEGGEAGSRMEASSGLEALEVLKTWHAHADAPAQMANCAHTTEAPSTGSRRSWRLHRRSSRLAPGEPVLALQAPTSAACAASPNLTSAATASGSGPTHGRKSVMGARAHAEPVSTARVPLGLTKHETDATSASAARSRRVSVAGHATSAERGPQLKWKATEMEVLKLLTKCHLQRRSASCMHRRRTSDLSA